MIEQWLKREKRKERKRWRQEETTVLVNLRELEEGRREKRWRKEREKCVKDRDIEKE